LIKPFSIGADAQRKKRKNMKADFIFNMFLHGVCKLTSEMLRYQKMYLAAMHKILCLALLYFTCSMGLHGQVFDFQHFSLEEGLPKSGVYDMLQDRDGYLWVATEGGGICKFDGLSFECFDDSNGLAGNIVRCLFEDSQGRLWVGTQEGGLSMMENGSFTNYTTENGMPSNHVRTITEDREGHIWAGTLGGGLAHFHSGEIEVFNEKNGLPHNKIRSSVCDSLGNPWFCTDAGLAHWEGNQLITYSTEHGLPHQKVLNAFVDDDSRLWFGCENGVVFMEDGAFRAPGIAALGQVRVRAISQDESGMMWFGCREGVYCSSRTDAGWTTTKYDQRTGLSSNRIRVIYRDRSNAMWVGTYFGGINRFNGESFAKYGATAGFPENNVTSIFEDASGSIWMGTFDGSVYVYDGDLAHKVHSNVSMEDNTVTCFGQAPSGTIYFGTLRQGAYKVENGKTSPYCLPGEDVLDIAPYKDGAFFATTNGLYSTSNDRLRYVMMNDTACHVVEVVGDSILLVGSESGLYKCQLPFRGARSLVQGTEGVVISSISKDGRGYYWVGTMGHGLLRCNLEKVRKYRNSSYLSSYDINFAQTDINDNLWIGTARNLHLLELDPTQSIVLNDRTFSPENGYTGGETNRSAAIIDSKGTLWIGTVRGVVSHSMGSGYLYETPPVLRMNRVTLFDKDVDWSSYTSDLDTIKNIPRSFSLDHNQNSLTFGVKALDLRMPEDINYQFMLEGHDFEWGPIQPNSFITYNSLAPGDYVFMCRSQNAAGFWNDSPITIPFSINAPLYQRAWFIAICAVLAAILFYLVTSIRVRILQREKNRLEKKVRERTVELEAAKQQSDDLLLNILPHDTAEELKQNGSAKTRHYPMVSVLFSDFTGFTTLSEQYNSEDLVDALDQCFKEFDRLTDKYKVEKIKTIGDAYMCATGLPSEDSDHATNLAGFAFEMQKIMERFNEQNRQKSLPQWHIRIGIHSGPVIAGVVGEKKFAYDIWGDTVNIAARMESSGTPDKVNISQSTFELLGGGFSCSYRGEIEAKNKGKLRMYFIDGRIRLQDESVYEKRG
jgi:ligand-binding sensor domain-containing protein/class 3 adenylate cyclase